MIRVSLSMPLTLTLNPAASPFPFAALVAAAYSSVTTEFGDAVASAELSDGNSKIAESDLLGTLVPAAESASAKISSLVKIADSLSTTSSFPDLVAALDALDDQLTLRTFLVGRSLSEADFAIWGVIKASPKIAGVFKGGRQPHLSRWYTYIEGLPTTEAAIANLIEARATKARSSKTSAGFSLGLPNAVDGKVVTRFPPEPSGYLHIGHAKAAILNQYFAKMYHGKMIVRFDDTNPSKERTEFEETILEDLKLLDVKGDIMSHTSDHFDKLYDSCVEIIKRGKAYADDTEQLKMRQERMDGIASERRNESVETNLARFAEMAKGTPEGQRWCIRAKISVDDPNKALRDPVIYRVNMTPHHRTGDKWKVYPTYDFACPLVDALEGVTHALRTNEYRDRNPQYYWMLDALGLRKVDVWDFSRLNFIYTLLSKRKLHMFVDQKLVEGWDDPRFPTVRGIRRRGLTIEALRQYMYSQGPSQSTVSLEWDSLWNLNKKVIDPIAPRYWAFSKDKLVKVELSGISTTEVKSNPLHKKNSDCGTKSTVYGPTIYVEQEDAASFDDNEEVTLMDWGNAFIRSKEVSPSGDVLSIKAELHLEGDFKKTKKKITWIAAPSSSQPHIAATLHDYDYLITKKKLEEEDDVKDFITPVTEFKVDVVTDSNIRKLKKGDTIQFERKGYYILDKISGSEGGNDEHYKFVRIPDGKSANLASKADPPAGASSKPPADKGKGKDLKPKPKSPGSAPAAKEYDTPADTKMYKVTPIQGISVETPADTKMYAVKSIHAL